MRTITYYAITSTQSKAKFDTIICSVTVPSTLSPFRQQMHALKHAKALHFGEGIIGVVERSKLSLTLQLAISRSDKPSYIWSENE